MQAWGALYSVTAGAAATMLGLLFVAVSILGGASGGMHKNSRIIAEQSFSNYLVVILISALALFPSLTPIQLGITALGLTAVRMIWAAIRMYAAAMEPFVEGSSRWKSLRRQLPSLVGFALIIIAAGRLVLGYGDPRTEFAAGVVMLLFAATSMAWELLLRISAAKTE
jgi:uncharacterized membrane protein